MIHTERFINHNRNSKNVTDTVCSVSMHDDGGGDRDKDDAVVGDDVDDVDDQGDDVDNACDDNGAG